MSPGVRARTAGAPDRIHRPAAGSIPRMLWRDPGTESASLESHLRRHGPLPVCDRPSDRRRLIEEVGAAGILGRGGAGFPMARKLQAAVRTGRRPVVVGNGTEGEPAIDKDKTLLLQAPHLVADGASVVAQAVGADLAIIVVPEAVLPAVRVAIDGRRAAAIDPVEIRIAPAARGFVAGEASAVVGWLERGRPLPRMTPPHLTERGLRGRPTLVHNVETLAQLALVARHGAAWYRAVGTPHEPGSMLVTLCGAVGRPGVLEVPLGIPLRDLVEPAAGPGAGAVLVGGYSGAWLGEDDWHHVELSRSSLRTAGATPGAGLVAVLPRDRCGLVETARVVRYLAGESAGQCGPCRFGLDAVADEFERLAHSRSGDVDRLRRWLDQIDGRGACGHPDGVARLGRSTLRVFADELAHHRAGWCRGTAEAAILPLPPKEGEG